MTLSRESSTENMYLPPSLRLLALLAALASGFMTESSHDTIPELSRGCRFNKKCWYLALFTNCRCVGRFQQMVTVEEHPLLELAHFVAEFPCPLEKLGSSVVLGAMLQSGDCAPMHSDEAVRKAIRDMLRHGGYKPTGRGKPASEYLVRAVEEGSLSSINLAVDVCNVVSFHSGLPISVVDFDLVEAPLHVGLATAGASYVFNAAQQVIDLGGLLCLFDHKGPCANGVKDSQRTKTSPSTRRTLSLIWGTRQLPGRAAAAQAWYEQMLRDHGATIRSH
ncbi:MAG: hypothetical protein KDA42_15945 [Planctomycetales bacterium]|nr:hypothetical protein [Planctomycetales bacterium]